MTPLEHAKTIKAGMTVYSKKDQIIVPVLAEWWSNLDKLKEGEAPDTLIHAMPDELARTLYGAPVIISFDTVLDWKHLTEMNEIMREPVLLAQYSYLLGSDLQRKMARIKLLGR